jgi:hypothetical protein
MYQSTLFKYFLISIFLLNDSSRGIELLLQMKGHRTYIYLLQDYEISQLMKSKFDE